MAATSRPVRTALISVSDKSGILDFARALHERSVAILSTGGSAAMLRDAGLPVTEVSDHTGFNEIMDGRVKTLHPKIHGGILGRRGQDDGIMADNGITPIDLVVVNLYPFEATVAAQGCTLADAIENIDIGGPAMLRAAAKNHAHVAVVTDHADYARIVDSMDAHGGAVDDATRFDLATRAFEHTAQYDGAIANYLGVRVAGEAAAEDDEQRVARFPRTWNMQWRRREVMRYGENPHQAAAFYVTRDAPPGSVAAATQLQGKALSYNNIADTDAALECVRAFDEAPACVIVKHANPCGVAVDDSLLAAYRRAFSTDPESAFGGIIAFNRELDAATAAEIVEKQFVEVIVAPTISAEAAQAVSGKTNVRLLACGQWEAGMPQTDFKRVRGGVLVQDADEKLNDELRVVSERHPDAKEMRDLLFAWRVACYVKSNAIVYARDNMTIGVGAGQMSRVNSARIAAIKAEHAGLAVSGAVMASDAFFPFRDGLDNAGQAGIRAVIQPGGSMRDDEVIGAANEHDIAMVFTGTRHFRH